jgi:hypothetical protein
MNKGLINIIVKATDNATPNIRRIGRAIGGLGKVAGNIKNDFKIVGAGIAGIAVGLGAFAASAAAGAAADEQATATLISSLKARGLATEEVLAAVEKQIVAGQKLAFTDDEVRASVEASTRFTKNYAVAQKIQTVAMNLARTTGMSLQDATIAVGKAYQGSGAKLLTSIGITKKGIKGQEALNALLGKTKGAAAAYADTVAGSFDALKIGASELKEQFGKAFLPAIGKLFKALNPYIEKLSNTIKANTPQIQKWADIIVNKIINKLPKMFDAVQRGVPRALKSIEGFIDKISGIGKSADGLLGPGGSITLLVTGIGAAFGGLKGAITANLVKDGMDPFTALIVANITAVIPAALAEVFTKAIVTKAIATFGASVAAAATAGAVVEGGAAAVAGGAASVGTAALVIAALPEILAAAAVVAAVGGLALVINEMNKNPVQEIQNMPGFTMPSIFDILFPKKGAFNTGVGLGTNNPMTAKYDPTIVVQIGEKKIDAIVTDSFGRILHGTGGR